MLNDIEKVLLSEDELKKIVEDLGGIKMKYTIETIPYTQPYHYTTLKEAKRKQSELRKQGKKSHIICVTENGNDYILAN